MSDPLNASNQQISRARQSQCLIAKDVFDERIGTQSEPPMLLACRDENGICRCIFTEDATVPCTVGEFGHPCDSVDCRPVVAVDWDFLPECKRSMKSKLVLCLLGRKPFGKLPGDREKHKFHIGSP